MQSHTKESSTSTPSTVVLSTLLLVNDIYTQVMGPERHGRVHGLGFGPTPKSFFRATSRRETNATLASKLKDTQAKLMHFKQRHQEHEKSMQKKFNSNRNKWSWCNNTCNKCNKWCSKCCSFNKGNAANKAPLPISANIVFFFLFRLFWLGIEEVSMAFLILHAMV